MCDIGSSVIGSITTELNGSSWSTFQIAIRTDRAQLGGNPKGRGLISGSIRTPPNHQKVSYRHYPQLRTLLQASICYGGPGCQSEKESAVIYLSSRYRRGIAPVGRSCGTRSLGRAP